MALSYRQVKDLYDQLRDAGATSVSLPEWSQEMNQLTGTDLYGEGRKDNILKRAGVGIDRALESVPGLVEGATSLGRGAGRLVGNEEAGAAIGATLPRLVVNTLPYLIPGAGLGFAVARLGGAAALAGIDAYTQTGSPAAGLTSAALAAVLPKGTELLEQAVLKRMGVKPLTGSIVKELETGPGGVINRLVTSPVSQLYPESFGQKVAAYSAGEAAASGIMEGQRWGEEYFNDQPLHNPFSSEGLLNIVLGQIPFAGVHAATKLAGGHDPRAAMSEAIKRAEKLTELKRVQDAMRDQTDIERIPTISATLTPEEITALTERRADLRSQQEAITAKTTLTPEDAERLQQLIDADNATPAVTTRTSALGAEQGSEHVKVTGRQIHETAKWRKIFVSDIEDNPPELRGKVVEYSKGLREPPPTELEPGSALSVFGVTADPLWRTVISLEEQTARDAHYAEARRARLAEKSRGTPELPEQAAPAVDYFAHISDLDRIEVQIDAARTPAEIQKSVLALRALQERAGLSDLSDPQLRRMITKLAEKGETKDAEKKAIKARMARDKKVLEAQAKRDEDTKVIQSWFAEKQKADPSGYLDYEWFSDALEKRGVRGNKLVSSGKLAEMFYALRDDPNAMARLQAQVEEAMSNGKGIKEERQVLSEIKESLKDNEDAESFINILYGSALQALQSRSAKKAFDEWDRRDETNWDYEKRTFAEWVQEYGVPSKEDVADVAEFFAERDGVPLAEVKDELTDFLDRPHVKEWMTVFEGLVQDKKAHAPQPQQIMPLPAGNGFVWGMAGYDETTNRLGGKHTIPKSGEITEAQLKAIGGRGKPLQDVEIEMMKALDQAVGGGAFDGKGNVNVKTLQKVLKENPVVVETHEYGMEGKASPNKDALDKLTHDWYETLSQDQRVIVDDFVESSGWAERERVSRQAEKLKVDRLKLLEFATLKDKVASEPPDSSPRATSYYSSISPFDTKKFPVVRVDVTLAREIGPKQDDGAGGLFRKGELWSPDNLHENLPNTLGWAMVQFVPDPRTGETVAFVGEQQSRWGQTVQKRDASVKETITKELNDKAVFDWKPWTHEDGTSGITVKTPGTTRVFHLDEAGAEQAAKDFYEKRKEEYRISRTKDFGKHQSDHPLLPLQHTLVLKAVIAEAAKRGVKKVVVSDGESAMMMERQDKAVLPNIPQTRVVGSDGKPKLVYHADVYSSDTSFQPRAGQHFGTRESAEGRISAFREGREDTTFVTDERGPISDQPKISSVWLNIKNPKRVHDVGQVHKWDKLIREAKAEGYDGLVYRNDHEGFGDSYVVFEPNQVIVAEDNARGGEFKAQRTFDTEEAAKNWFDRSPSKANLELQGKTVVAKGQTAYNFVSQEHIKPEFRFKEVSNQPEPSQSGGMRLHYDTTLPSAMRKLTGDEGERVEMGVHKNATEAGLGGSTTEAAAQSRAQPGDVVRQRETDGMWEIVKAKGSPVFRNPDGTPKSSVTGIAYDLTKAQATLGEQGGFTLGDPARAPRAKQQNVEAFRSDIPEVQEVVTKLTTDGHGLIKELLLDTDPFVSSLAKDLSARFPEALARVDSGVYQTPGSYAARRSAGRVGIFLDPSIPMMSAYARNNVVLHELIHGLTLHELGNPQVRPEVIQELTALRQRLVEALPAKLREAYEVAQATNWYQRFSDGTADMDELHENPRYQQLLYGLLNNDEMVSQGFTSRDLREFMQSVGGKKTNGWKSFTNWVKKILGVGEKIDETAFGDFLSTTNQLLTHGEWLADFSNFGERYFENQGKGGAYGRVQTSRALGMIADSAHGINEPLTIAKVLDLGSYMSTGNARLKSARRTLDKVLQAEPETKAHLASALNELGHKTIDDVVTDAVGNGADISTFIDLMPPEVGAYVFEKLRDAHDVLDVIRAASTKKNEGMTNIANPKLLRDSVLPVLKNVRRALMHEDFTAEMARNLVGLHKITPEGLLDEAPRFAPKIVEDFLEGSKDVGGNALGAFARFIEPVGQWARRVPEVAEAVSKGFQLQANARKMFHEAVKWLGMDTSSPYVDVLTEESVAATERTLANPKLLDRINKWMYWNNEKNRSAVTMLPENDPEIVKLLAGLSDEEKELVRSAVNNAGKVTQTMNTQKLEKMNQIAATNGAAVAALSTGLKTRDNVALAAKLLEGIQKSSDPMTSNDGMIAIQNVQQRMQPEPFIELYDFLRGEADKIKLWKQYFDANPFWATAQRTERFLIKALNKQGKAVTLQASTKKEANDILAKKGYKLKELVDQWDGKEDEPFAYPNLNPDLAKRLEELEANQIAMLEKAGVLDSTNIEEFRRTSAVGQALREATAQRSIPGVQAPARLLSQGAEELPWMWNHLSWAQKEANYWSRALLRAQQRAYSRDAEVRTLPEAEQKRLRTHFDNLLVPDPKIAQQMTRFASTWFLGYNMATSMINAAQPFVTHVAELTALTGRPLESYRRVTNALNEVIGRFGANPLSKFGTKDWASKEHEQLMNDAVKDGEVGIGMYDDEAAAQESIAYNYKRAMKKEAPKTAGQRAGSLARGYSTAGLWVFQHGERLNARAALLAAFDYYREQGLNFKDAKEKAYEFNHAVNFGGGRAQRPVGAYSSRAPFLRGAAMLGTSLQSYVLGTTAQIARYLQRGFFRPNGITPGEIHAARKAALQMLGTQFAAAGVLGMPFVSGAIALLDKAFPELELNKNLRETMNSFLSEDEENGNVLTDVAMTGVPSMFGWDMQSRLSMGNTLPGVSEVNGFQPENLLGPPVNIVRNFVNGTTGWAKGEAKAGLNFLPPAVRKLVEAGQAALSDPGGIRDYAGRPLEEPTRGEYLGAFLGFQPKRLSEQNAASRMLKQSEEVLRTQESRFRTQQAEEILRGNFGTVRQELRARKQETPEYDEVGAVQAIARAAEELAFPRDLRREGTTRGSGKRSKLLEAYGMEAKATEVQRLQFRKKVEQGLGLQSDIRQELQVATLMDQLRLRDPDATRLELKSAALEALGRAARQRQLLPQEFQ